jgi:hypothetical protein
MVVNLQQTQKTIPDTVQIIIIPVSFTKGQSVRVIRANRAPLAASVYHTPVLPALAIAARVSFAESIPRLDRQSSQRLRATANNAAYLRRKACLVDTSIAREALVNGARRVVARYRMRSRLMTPVPV